MSRYDLIVVGAGPAGLEAARSAAARGYSVALLERRQQLTPLTRACSEGLLFDEHYMGDRISIDREHGQLVFAQHALRLPYSGPVRMVPRFSNVSPAGHRMTLVRDDAPGVHVVFDKARFLEENRAAAQQAGATLLHGRTVTSLETGAESVTVGTAEGTVTGRFLIAADGHNSLCARLAGFDRERSFYGTLSCACWHITGFEPPSPDHIHLVEGRGGPAIICLCPRCYDGQYNVMISRFDQRRDFELVLDRIRHNSPVAPFFTGDFRVLHRLGCVLNLFSPLRDPCRDNIFLAGDAAWMGQTSNSHAALMGHLIVETIHHALQEGRQGEEIYAPYRQWWQTHVADAIKPPGANLFEELEAHELDDLLSRLPAEIPGSLEPRRAQQLVGAMFQQIMPQLQQDAPELMARISAIMQTPSDEAWKEKRAVGCPVRTVVKM